MPSHRFRRETAPIWRSPTPGQNANSLCGLVYGRCTPPVKNAPERSSGFSTDPWHLIGLHSIRTGVFSQRDLKWGSFTIWSAAPSSNLPEGPFLVVTQLIVDPKLVFFSAPPSPCFPTLRVAIPRFVCQARLRHQRLPGAFPSCVQKFSATNVPPCGASSMCWAPRRRPPRRRRAAVAASTSMPQATRL